MPQPADCLWTRILCKQPDRYIGWPSIARLKSGELLVVFSGDRDPLSGSVPASARMGDLAGMLQPSAYCPRHQMPTLVIQLLCSCQIALY